MATIGKGQVGMASALTCRQHEVLSALQSGSSEKEIAYALEMSPHTVHAHVKAIYERLRVCSRGELLSLRIQRPPVACEDSDLAGGGGEVMTGC